MNKLRVRTPQEMEEDIYSTPTVTWNPFTVFPREIYLKIFNKIDSPTDKLNFMNAHAMFYELFKAERVQFLFGIVFCDFELVKAKRLTDFRLVCRDWDRSIQDFYQLHQDHFQFLFNEDSRESTYLRRIKGLSSNGYEIRFTGGLLRAARVKSLETYLEEFLASHPPSKNPFLMRKINMDLDGECNMYLEQYRSFLSQIGTLFETFGQHIYHLRIQTYVAKLTPEMFERILEWLKLLPELRTLQLNFNYDNDKHSQTNYRIEPPEMRKLQNLHVLNLPAFAFNHLLARTNLEKVEISCTPPFIGFKVPTGITEAAFVVKTSDDKNYLKQLTSFPVLSKLIINLDFRIIEGVNPLTKNRSDPFKYKRWYSHEWKKVWRLIEKKFPALEDLHLRLPRANYSTQLKRRVLMQSLKCKLNLPKLKRLNLILPNLACLDFLQEIKTLEELTVKLDYFEEANFDGWNDLARKENVQFSYNMDLDDMWASNIWWIFPKLRKLCIHAIRLENGRGVIEVHTYIRGRGQKRIYYKIIRSIPINSPYYDLA